ncbi:unnamed protein product, partial [Pocillopora meandrina]
MYASYLLTWFKQEVKKTCELCHLSDIKKKGKPYMLRIPHFQTTEINVMNLMCSTFHCDDMF